MQASRCAELESEVTRQTTRSRALAGRLEEADHEIKRLREAYSNALDHAMQVGKNNMESKSSASETQKTLEDLENEVRRGQHTMMRC